MSARSNGSCMRLKIFCRRSVVKGSAHTPIVPCLALLGEDVLVVALPHGHEQAVVVGVEELVAGALRRRCCSPAVPLTLRRNADWS